MINKEQVKFITIFYPKLIENIKEDNESEKVQKKQILYYSNHKTFNPPLILGEELNRLTDDIGTQLKNIGMIQAFNKFINTFGKDELNCIKTKQSILIFYEIDQLYIAIKLKYNTRPQNECFTGDNNIFPINISYVNNVLKQAYSCFNLFNGSIINIIKFNEEDANNFKIKIEIFFDKWFKQLFKLLELNQISFLESILNSSSIYYHSNNSKLLIEKLNKDFVDIDQNIKGIFWINELKLTHLTSKFATEVNLELLNVILFYLKLYCLPKPSIINRNFLSLKSFFTKEDPKLNKKFYSHFIDNFLELIDNKRKLPYCLINILNKELYLSIYRYSERGFILFFLDFSCDVNKILYKFEFLLNNRINEIEENINKDLMFINSKCELIESIRFIIFNCNKNILFSYFNQVNFELQHLLIENYNGLKNNKEIIIKGRLKNNKNNYWIIIKKIDHLIYFLLSKSDLPFSSIDKLIQTIVDFNYDNEVFKIDSFE